MDKLTLIIRTIHYSSMQNRFTIRNSCAGEVIQWTRSKQPHEWHVLGHMSFIQGERSFGPETLYNFPLWKPMGVHFLDSSPPEISSFLLLNMFLATFFIITGLMFKWNYHMISIFIVILFPNSLQVITNIWQKYKLILIYSTTSVPILLLEPQFPKYFRNSLYT